MSHPYLQELRELLATGAPPADMATLRGGGLRRQFLPHSLQLADSERATYLGGHLEVLRVGAAVMLRGMVIDTLDQDVLSLRVIELPVVEHQHLTLAQFIIDRSIQENTATARNGLLLDDLHGARRLHQSMQLASVWVESGHHKIGWARPPKLPSVVGDRLPLLQLNLAQRLSPQELDTFQGQKLLKRARRWFTTRHGVDLGDPAMGIRLPDGFVVAMVNRMHSPIPAVIMRHGDDGLAMSRFMEF